MDQDALGLSRIYVQAKRYAVDTAVGRLEIQAFVGALHGDQALLGRSHLDLPGHRGECLLHT